MLLYMEKMNIDIGDKNRVVYKKRFVIESKESERK